MDVETLIEVLQQVPDKKLLVRLDMPKNNEDDEQNGEVTLWGEE